MTYDVEKELKVIIQLCLHITGHRRMQNVTNYFLVNLSFADLMMSCLNTIFNFTFMKNRYNIINKSDERNTALANKV